MLVLTRQLGERIVIGQDIVIEVTRIGKERVWLGITAPKDTPIHREEVAKAIERGLDRGKRGDRDAS